MLDSLVDGVLAVTPQRRDSGTERTLIHCIVGCNVVTALRGLVTVGLRFALRRIRHVLEMRDQADRGW